MPGDRSATSAGLAALQLVLEEEHYRALPAEDLLGRYLGERDERAFAALVRRYGRLVMARCREVLGREDLAQEAFQETFTQLVLNGHRVRRRGAVGHWLARIARRRSLDVGRRERRQRSRDRAVEPRPGGTDPQVMVADADIRRALARAMTGLPERFRLPIELVYLDGMTHAEAASALGCPKGTVDSYVRRGLEKLKRALGASAVPVVAGGTIALIPPAQAVTPECIRGAMQAATAVPIPPPPRTLTLLAERVASPPVIAAAAVVCVAVVIGWAQWPEARPESRPAPIPVPPAVVESLPEQNLRLLRTVIAPKVCDELRGLTADGKPPAIVETEAYDSRVRILFEGSYKKSRLSDVGEKSRSMFYFDTGRRRAYLYMDRKSDGNWRPINLEHPIILIQETGGKILLSKQIPELTAAVKVFDDLPRDPRAEAEVEKRRLALREQLNSYVGDWYRDGDRKQPRRVELVEPLGLAFYQGSETEAARVVTEEEIWACEARSRAWPINADGMLGCIRVGLQDDEQTVVCWPLKGAWKRVAAK